MKFPSLASLADAARTTLLRFPFVLLAGLIGAFAIIQETDDERWVLLSWLGISLLFGIALFSERRGWGLPMKLAAQGAGIALLALYFLSLPFDLDTVDQTRFCLFLIGTHLFAAFAPFTVRNEVEGFWRYNEILFLRILIAALFTLVLYGGLALALVSIDRLFNVEVSSDAYRDLAAILFGLVNTWFFLAGVPADFRALKEGGSYPRGLKIFTQYVLLPLVSIYLIILYLYAGKIVLTWQWPNGWVSALVIGFAVAGILSALLLWPIREQEGNHWIRRFSGGFYWGLLPLIVLLLLAIWRRISDYGITENRYFVIVTALWLAGIAIYFIISRRDDIKVIPITLCILALAGTFGPWSAFNVSINSQVTRLHDLLAHERVVVDGAVAPPRKGDTIAKDMEERVYSILYFLDSRGALSRLASLLPASRLDTMSVEDVARTLGLANRFAYGGSGNYSDPNAGPFDLQIDRSLGADRIFPVAGFTVVHDLEMTMLTARPQRFDADGFGYALSYDDAEDILRVDADSAGSATFDLPAIIDRVVASASAPGDSTGGDLPRRLEQRLATLPRATLTVDGAGSLRCRLVISHATVNRIEGRTKVSSYEARLLIGGR